MQGRSRGLCTRAAGLGPPTQAHRRWANVVGHPARGSSHAARNRVRRAEAAAAGGGPMGRYGADRRQRSHRGCKGRGDGLVGEGLSALKQRSSGTAASTMVASGVQRGMVGISSFFPLPWMMDERPSEGVQRRRRGATCCRKKYRT